MDLTGIIPPMITPVSNGDGDINVDATKAFSRFLVDNGVHGLFPAGSIGEFPSITKSQRAVLIETVVDTSDDVPVVAGCGGTSLSHVKSLVSDAKLAGADAAVVVTPYYYNPTQEGLRLFYEDLADSVDLPIVMYNIPQLTGTNLSRNSVITLADHPNIIGLKDSSRNFEYFANVNRQVPESFTLLQGSPELALASLDIGADGLVPGPANVLPGLVVELYQSHSDGGGHRSLEILEDQLLPMINITRPISSSAALKFLLRQMGYDVGDPLLPITPLSQPEKDRLRACYRDIIQPRISTR